MTDRNDVREAALAFVAALGDDCAVIISVAVNDEVCTIVYNTCCLAHALYQLGASEDQLIAEAEGTLPTATSTATH